MYATDEENIIPAIPLLSLMLKKYLPGMAYVFKDETLNGPIKRIDSDFNLTP
jgi:hypothetical protein